MRVERSDLGKWQVISPEGEVISEHDTNGQAWKSLDRLSGEPTSKREDTADWIYRKSLNGASG